jgi:hypothetical protein
MNLATNVRFNWTLNESRSHGWISPEIQFDNAKAQSRKEYSSVCSLQLSYDGMVIMRSPAPNLLTDLLHYGNNFASLFLCYSSQRPETISTENFG